MFCFTAVFFFYKVGVDRYWKIYYLNIICNKNQKITAVFFAVIMTHKMADKKQTS